MTCPTRTTSDKVLLDKVFNMGENPKYVVCRPGLVSNVYNFDDKNSAGANTSCGTVKRARSETLVTRDKRAIKIQVISNQGLAEELHKPIN